jgi:hypothetical protein
MSAKKQATDGDQAVESDVETVPDGQESVGYSQPDLQNKTEVVTKAEPKAPVRPKAATEVKPSSKEKVEETKTLAEIMKFDLKIRRPRR